MAEARNKRVRILLCGMICCLIMGFCYMYSIIQPYVMEYFGIESAAAALPYTIFLAVFVLGNYIGGVLQKKNECKKDTANRLLLHGGRYFMHWIPAERAAPADVADLRRAAWPWGRHGIQCYRCHDAEMVYG